MLSVILYGRNDSYGYNLHKRAAISLNCIAEMLSGEHDEIIFVDYNTPNDLPTFIEAIYDTLTPRARWVLRVLRVRPEVHHRLYGTRTHLAALEAICRNIGVRRSNPQNRWILSTNTDMIFVPRNREYDLTTAVSDLADGYYILPRFELPEPFWESFPRMDPAAIIRACNQLGAALHLNEVTLAHPYMRFDNPGDAQFLPRQTLFDIFGFDERLIHGWHVDSNMCKRLFHLYGVTGSLADRLKGYHCDHTRERTLAHRLDFRIESDPHEFVYNIDNPYASHQSHSWGLPEDAIEEIDFGGGPPARFVSVVQRTLGVRQDRDYHSDSNDGRNYLFYHPEHVLPYVAANLTVYPRDVRLLYIGNNPRLLTLLATCFRDLGFSRPLGWMPDLMCSPLPELADGVAAAIEYGPEDPSFSRSLITNHDVLIFDFGLDAASLPSSNVARITDWPRDQRYRLGAIARCLASCAEECHTVSRSTPSSSLPDFLVVNPNHHPFDQFVSQFLLTTKTPYNTRVRKGRARVGDERLYRSHRWKLTEEAMQSFFGYDLQDGSVPPLAPGDSIDFTSLASSSRYKDGNWGVADHTGTWIDGPEAVVLLSIDPAVEADLIAHVYVTETFLGPEELPIRVNVWFEGEHIAKWLSVSRYACYTSRLIIPQRLFAGKPLTRLVFEIENPQSCAAVARHRGEEMIGEDPRELSIKIQSLSLYGIENAHYHLGSPVDFTAEGRGAFYMDSCWATPDNYGAWTLGPEATLIMYLGEVPLDKLVSAVFTISDAVVTEKFPSLEVDVLFNDENVGKWVLGPTRETQERKVKVEPEVLKRRHPLSIAFHIPAPRSPRQLNWSGDTRLLGFRLTGLRIEPLVIPVYRMGQVIDFTEKGNAAPYLEAGWNARDDYGCWTLGTEATLTLRLDPRPDGPTSLSVLISEIMVDATAPTLPVEVVANGKMLAEWTMGPDRTPHQRTVELPAEVIPLDGSLSLAFRIATPRTPASMGWSSDLRPLGIRLTRAVIGGRGLLDLVARGWAALLGRSRTETSQSQPEDKDVSLSK